MDKIKIAKLLKKGKNIVLVGAPGSGKGTYAKRMAPFLNIPHISSGDLIRMEIKNKTELGEKVQKVTERGDLISDSLLMQIIEKRLSESDTSNGFIMDGVPRTLNQVTLLDNIKPINLVLEIGLREDILLNKALARRCCQNCGEQYNLFACKKDGYDMPPLLPKKENICDKCGANLFQRSDDNKETIQKRIDLYKTNYGPIASEYKKRGILQRFELKSGVKVMWPILKESLINVY